MENQLTILSESLDKKLEVLQKIREYNKRQEEIFSAEEVDMSLFDDAVEEKQRLIDEVVHLDEGFEIMYEKLAKGVGRQQRTLRSTDPGTSEEGQQGDRTQRVRTGTGGPEQKTASRVILRGNVPKLDRDGKTPKVLMTTTRA